MGPFWLPATHILTRTIHEHIIAVPSVLHVTALRRNKVLAEPTISCPNCKTDIRLTELLAAPLIAETRRRFEQQLAAKDQDIAAAGGGGQYSEIGAGERKGRFRGEDRGKARDGAISALRRKRPRRRNFVRRLISTPKERSLPSFRSFSTSATKNSPRRRERRRSSFKRPACSKTNGGPWN